MNVLWTFLPANLYLFTHLLIKVRWGLDTSASETPLGPVRCWSGSGCQEGKPPKNVWRVGHRCIRGRHGSLHFRAPSRGWQGNVNSSAPSRGRLGSLHSKHPSRSQLGDIFSKAPSALWLWGWHHCCTSSLGWYCAWSDSWLPWHKVLSASWPSWHLAWSSILNLLRPCVSAYDHVSTSQFVAVCFPLLNNLNVHMLPAGTLPVLWYFAKHCDCYKALTPENPSMDDKNKKRIYNII